MLSIQQFAELCHSTTQTLRYYDKEGVLKPYYIAKSSRYRYYLEEQAFDFFKIKQLQEAGFSLEEIKNIKDRKDDEIIEALNGKLIQLIERINKIEKLKETYLNEKMELESKVENFACERLKVMAGTGQLMIATQQDQVKLKCKKEPKAIADLLNEMQKQILIGMDSLQDLKKYDKLVWNYTEIYHGWHNADELLTQFKQIPDAYSFAIHLFNIDETISLYDIDEIISASDFNEIDKRDILFNVSLSEKHSNSYAILYAESGLEK